MDAARTALRLGADEVVMVYRHGLSALGAGWKAAKAMHEYLVTKKEAK